MQKIWILAFLSCCFGLFAMPAAQSEQELLHARRIIDFWHDHEVHFVKTEIEQFLKDYPHSNFKDHFYAILGDLALEEGRFAQALSSYQLVKSSDVKREVRSKRWNALYQLKQYEQLYQEIAPQLSLIKEEEVHFYFAEAALREALSIDSSPQGQLLKDRLFQEALAAYEPLQNSPRFEEHAKLAMAEIYRRTDQLKAAADLYLQVAQIQKSPQILYHAALLLTQCGYEQKAEELFAKLAKGGGNKAADAASQWFQMIVRNQCWDILEKERRIFLATLPTEHLPIYHFYLGMYAYNQHSYQEAVTSLSESLAGGLKPPYDKNAIQALLICGKELALVEVVDKAFMLLKDRYQEETEKASLVRAICYKKAQLNDLALTQLLDLLKIAHHPVVIEETMLEAISLLVSAKQWDKAHDITIQFIESFPYSDHYKKIATLAVDLSLQLLDTPDGIADLTANLQRALGLADLYNETEKIDKQLLLAKCLFKQEKFSQLQTLLIELFNTAPETADLHYLQTICSVKSKEVPEKIIAHGEKVLELDPTFSEAARVHLYLFNAYLDLSHQSQQQSLAYIAANHLYEVVDLMPISLENQLWLAHMYAKQKVSHPKAMHILETIVLGKDNRLQSYPEEAFLLAKLYQQIGLNQKALMLLEPLCSLQKNAEIQLSLALAYKATGHYHQAADLLQMLEKNSDIKVALTAKLTQARLILDKHLKVEDEGIAFKNLKELWVRKDLHQEPIHLEAALDYQAYMSPYQTPRQQLKLLLELKEHFTAQNDICSKDYHEARLQNPEQDCVYQAYMRYLDAKIYAVEAKLPNLSPEEALSKQRAAHALFSTLLQGRYAVSTYIIQKAEDEVK